MEEFFDFNRDENWNKKQLIISYRGNRGNIWRKQQDPRSSRGPRVTRGKEENSLNLSPKTPAYPTRDLKMEMMGITIVVDMEKDVTPT